MQRVTAKKDETLVYICFGPSCDELTGVKLKL